MSRLPEPQARASRAAPAGPKQATSNNVRPSGPSEGPPRGRRRRRKPRGPQPPRAPAEVVARAAEAKPPLLPDQPAELALSREELAVMREHLRFLKDHRKVLHLRTNAHEDLLLNEVRPPTRRGVCQHLLAKVDRARVFSAAERLDPAAATRLAEGVLRISPDVDYLLLYLSCVRRSAAAPQSAAALAEALERIDFAQVSSGQMRRVLDLVVEHFDERNRPSVLFGLLEGNAFRKSFDAAAAELPEPLANLVVPLRAVQAVIVHDRPNPHSPEMLERGVTLLLSGDERSVLRYPAPARRRLLKLGLQSTAATDPNSTRTLGALLEALRQTPEDYQALALEWIRRLLGADQEARARRQLEGLLRELPDCQRARTWLDTLGSARVGRVALGESRSPNPDRKAGSASPQSNVEALESSRRGRRALGVMIDDLGPVTVLFADGPEDPDHRALMALAESLALPGVCAVRTRGIDTEGRPFFAVQRHGQLFSHLLGRRGSREPGEVVGWCAEAAAILGAVARAGVRLSDADPRRFEANDAGRLWLADLRGASPSDPASAEAAHLGHLQALCANLLFRGATFLPPPGLFQRLEQASSLAEAHRALIAHAHP